MPSTHSYLVQKPFSSGCKTRNAGQDNAWAVGLHLAAPPPSLFLTQPTQKPLFHPCSFIPPSCKVLLLGSIFLSVNLNVTLPIFKPPRLPSCTPGLRPDPAGPAGPAPLARLARGGCLPARPAPVPPPPNPVSSPFSPEERGRCGAAGTASSARSAAGSLRGGHHAAPLLWAGPAPLALSAPGPVGGPTPPQPL